MMKKRIAAILLSLALLAGSISASPIALAEDAENLPELSSEADSLLAEEDEITKGTLSNTEYTVTIPRDATAEETTLTLSEIFATEGEDVPAEAVIESGTITGALFGLDSETELSLNTDRNAIIYTPISEITAEMTGKAVFTLSSSDYENAEITVNFEVSQKLFRDDAEYNITVESTNTDTTEKTVSLSTLLGGEDIPSENVAVTPKSEDGDISDIISDIEYSEGSLKYIPCERPEDGKAGTLVFTVSSDDYEDFTLTINLKAEDTRESIEDISFEELMVAPDEYAGVYTGYPLDDVAAAAFDNPMELLQGFAYHGISFSENAEQVLKEAETYYTDDWGGYFIFTFEEPLERGDTAWVRYEVSSDKYKPFGLILYFTVPKLERADARYIAKIDAFGEPYEKELTLSALLGGQKVPQNNVRVSEISKSDNFSEVIGSMRYEDNTLIYTPVEEPEIGATAELVFDVSSGDYNDFTLKVVFNVLDTRQVHGDVSQSISLSHNNTDITEKTLTVAEMFGGADKVPSGLSLDLPGKTISGDAASVFLDLEVTETGIVYSVKESPKERETVEIIIPAVADGYKEFTVTVTFKVSANKKTSSAFVVHFDTDGGSKITNVVVKSGNRLAEPAEPKKEGYIFGGWYTTKELTLEYDFTRRVGRNFTLYAKWTKEKADDNTGSTDATENGGNQQAEVYKIIFTIDKKEANVFGDEVTYDVAPIIVDGRTMLSARYVAENLGATVSWDASVGQGKVTITKGQTEMTLYIGEKYAHVNGEKVDLDVVPFIENGRTYYPARFIAERLGATVEWNENDRTVTISTTEKPVWNERFAD